MKIANQCIVSFHYTLTDDNGEQIDSSKSAEPLVYLHGAQGLIPGLERELEGCEVGDQFKATVAPEDAYGEIDDRLIQTVPLEALSGIDNLSVGMTLQSQGQDGQIQLVTVDKIDDDTATINANHALAGMTLHFDVTVEAVREATAEELEHGHPH